MPNHLRSPTPPAFDLLTCPLRGNHLLEAGAGTGKTFSLAFLYLRLLLERGLAVEEILVTTFTNAATAELKGRIFAQIQHAQQCFNALRTTADEATLAQQSPEQALLLTLLQQLRQQVQDDDLLAQRLRLALARFDYAQISSINGFALQLVRENADTINSYIPENIIDDDNDFVKQAYVDLARDNFAVLGTDATAVGEVVAGIRSNDCLALLTNMLANRDYLTRAEADVKQAAATVTTLIAHARASNPADAVALVSQAIADKQLNGRSYSATKLEIMAAQIDAAEAYSDRNFLTFFSGKNLLAKRNKNATATFTHPFFAACDELLAQGEGLSVIASQPRFSTLMQLTRALQQRVADLKAEHMALSHDDIVHLAAAGAEQVQTAFKAALIDEAQDTNLAQMQLFRRLFLQRQDKICFFVGDPKQAIYGFRGANIHSYLAIRQDVDHAYVMTRNYRSTQALNTSINTFFSGQQPFGADIAYHPIGWQKSNECSDFSHYSLTLQQAEAADTTTLAETGAAAIAALLTQAPHIERNTSTAGRALCAGDIAVLVRSSTQAELMKTALAGHGLAASFTGKVSVYQSNEAHWLLLLLSSIHRGDTRSVKALMLTPLFAGSRQCAHDQQAVHTLRAQLNDFAKVYQEKGFSVMFYQLLHTFHIAGRLLQSDDGKRRLSNFIQLFELLQAALQRQSLSLAGLCDHLNHQMHRSDKAGELRLEDDHAVTIMTMHSAKGLEFPVVCLPFFHYHRARTPKAADLWIDHRQQKALPAFVKLPDLMAAHQAAERAESMRLAYVALTRAAYHNVVVCLPDSDKNVNNASMLGTLFNTLPDSTIITAADFVAVSQQIPPAPSARLPALTTYHAKTLSRPLYSAWQLSSFSRLQQQAETQVNGDINTPPPATQTAVMPAANSLDNSENEPITGALADYPSGPRPGLALHEMYEHYMLQRQNDATFAEAIDASIARHLYAEDQNQRPDTPALAAAIADTATIALAPQSFCLNSISPLRQSIEMGFFMHFPPTARQQLLDAFTQPPQALSDMANTPPVSADSVLPIDGYLHGFIDYWFEHDGKYYVLDYKSNRLGTCFSDYSQTAMHAEMQHHRYDLQALIYTIALCKHLFISSEASYQENIGGYYYLFVRGMRRGSDSGIYAGKVEWALISRFLQ